MSGSSRTMAPGRHDRRNQIVLTLVGMLFAATSAQALSVTNEPTPWHLLDDESSLAVTIGLSDDERTGWSSNHAGLMFRLPTGERTRAYARWFHVVYDDAGVNASDRWPEIGVMEPVEVAIPDGELRQSDEVLLWNVLDRHVGWSRPEFGILGSMQWPLLGGLNYAASAWLPFASNELYPYAARSISGRIALRKELDLGPAFTLAFDGFLTRDMAPGGDLLTEDAMVGWSGGGAVLRVNPGGTWRLEGGLSAASSNQTVLELLRIEAGRSLGEGLRCRLCLEHHLGDDQDRPFATRVLAVWSLALPGGEESGDDLLE